MMTMVVVTMTMMVVMMPMMVVMMTMMVDMMTARSWRRSTNTGIWLDLFENLHLWSNLGGP